MTSVQIMLLAPAQRGLGFFSLKFIWEGKLSTGQTFFYGKEGAKFSDLYSNLSRTPSCGWDLFQSRLREEVILAWKHCWLLCNLAGIFFLLLFKLVQASVASRFFAQSWGSRKSHALVKMQAKLLSQRHRKIQWLRWDCLFLFLGTVSTKQVGGAAHPTSFYFVVLVFIPTSASQPMEKASNSFLKLWLRICTQNFHLCPSLWNSVT